MQAAQKELRTLKQEETTLVTLASKISDQLNRLKVEELALQNMVRIQNEEQERLLRGSMSAGSSKMLEERDNEMDHDQDDYDDDDDNKADLDLDVLGKKKLRKHYVDVEEEEEEEDDEQLTQMTAESMHQDIEQFVELL